MSSLDHLGPLARSVADLALTYDAMQGSGADDPVQAVRPPEPVGPDLEAGHRGLRIAVAGGHFVHEDLALRAARVLEREGVARCP